MKAVFVPQGIIDPGLNDCAQMNHGSSGVCMHDRAA